jgi:predicted HTH transcriptional regulator
MNMVEQVGSGVPRMKDLMTDAELPEPKYYFDGIFSIT